MFEHSAINNLYYRKSDGSCANRLSQLLSEQWSLDPEGVRAAWGERANEWRTCVQGIAVVPPGYRLSPATRAVEPVHAAPRHDRGSDLFRLLLRVIKESLCASKKIALALSGGLDSALLLAMTRRLLQVDIPVYYLSCDFGTVGASYNEINEAAHTAQAFDVHLNVKEVKESDFIEALPLAVAAAEAPFYNLHVISKYLLGRALKESGYDALITGDGADQTFAGVCGADYLPIVGALFKETQIRLCTPFLDEQVMAFVQHNRLCAPGKPALRAIGSSLLPNEIVAAEKVSRMAPPVDLSSMLDRHKASVVSAMLGLDLPEKMIADDSLKWLTLSLMVDALQQASGMQPDYKLQQGVSATQA